MPAKRMLVAVCLPAMAAVAPGPALSGETCQTGVPVGSDQAGQKIFVLREGTLDAAANPLRPLDRERVTVLLVQIGSASGVLTGSGASFTEQYSLRSFTDLNGGTIRWSSRPQRDREPIYVATGAARMIGPIRFERCEEAPRTRSAAPAPRARATKPASVRPSPGASASTPLPQGALAE